MVNKPQCIKNCAFCYLAVFLKRTGVYQGAVANVTSACQWWCGMIEFSFIINDGESGILGCIKIFF